jgi:hypothetical protein
MIKKINKILMVLILFSLSCDSDLFSKENSKVLSKFEQLGGGAYVIRYSNIILNYNGKNVKVPIYGGTYEDITYEELQKKQKEKNLSLFGGITIFTKNDEVGKTFHDILKFYKKSFFKNIDINKPSVIGNEGSSWYLIWYDFEYEGLPCSMMISVECDEQASLKKIEQMGYGRKQSIPVNGTIDMLSFNEKSPGISLRIFIGESSPFNKN